MKAKYVIAGALIWAVTVAAAVFITLSLALPISCRQHLCRCYSLFARHLCISTKL